MATMLAYPRHGILLNPSPNSHPSALPFPTESSPLFPSFAACSSRSAQSNNLYLSPPSAPSSSSGGSRSGSPSGGAPASSSSSTAAQESPRSLPRKIRFAPLPDPRRSVCVTDEGEELSWLPGASSTDGSNDSISADWPAAPADGRASPKSDSPGAIDDGSTPLAAQSPWSTPATTPATSPYPGPTPLGPASYLDYTPTPAPASPFFSKTKKLFKPLLPTKALSELKLNVSTEDVLTLGTINLFRTSSRDSTAGARPSGSRASSRERATQSDDDALGGPLGRSSSSASARKRSSIPFRRTQSYDTVQKAAPARTAPVSNGMQGQRMLNGRVYGSKRNAKNPFSNIPDKEPEFVEWGYGGMGSVKVAKEAGSMLWAPLQQSNTTVAGSAGDDDDGGSGMGWVKRRKMEREQREREERERQAQEAAAAADADATPVPPPAPAPTAAATTPEAVSPRPEFSLASMLESTSQVSTPKAESAPHHTGESSEYLHTALCLPAAPHLTRQRSSHRALPTVTEADAPASAPEDIVGELELELEDTREDSPEPASEASASPSDSVEDVSEAEDVDEEAAADEARPTAKGASVEFISKRRRT